MKEILGTKYAIDGINFTIQHLHQTGHVSMRKPHSHPTYELYYVLDGGRTFFINKTVYTAKKGDLIFINPNDIHRTTSSDELKCERILVNFSESFLELELSRYETSILSGKYDNSLFHFSVHTQAIIEELLEKMIHECHTMQNAYETFVRSLLVQVIIHIDRHTATKNEKKNASILPMHQKMTEIAMYLNEHFQEDITLQDVSNRFYISPSYLSRTFKKVTGFQFKEYLQTIRFKEAKRLLRESKEPISQIASAIGYQHTANFNVIFKKVTGFTPGQYRKNTRIE